MVSPWTTFSQKMVAPNLSNKTGRKSTCYEVGRKEELIVCLPRMRTASGAMKEIRQMDPNTNITESAIRRAIKRGEVKSVTNGVKHLVNLDDLLAYFAGESEIEPAK